MGDLLFLSVLLILGCGFSCLFHKKIEETIPLAVFTIIVILYISGLTASLVPGVIIIFLGSFFAFVFLAIQVKKNRSQICENCLTWGLAAFLLYFVLFLWNARGRFLSNWDEFSHWGTVIKNMYIFDDLGNVEGSTVLFRGYPPATALFSYFYTKLCGGFFESRLLHAMNIMLISMFLPCFANIERGKRGGGSFLALLLICLGIPMAFNGNVYREIYVDILLGMIFAYILYYYYHTAGKFRIINLCMALFVLTLVKASGAGLGFIAILIMAIDAFCKKKEWQVGEKIAFFVLLTAAVFLGKYSWDIYLKLTHTNEAWSMSQLTWENIKLFFTPDNPQYRVETLENFLEHFFTGRSFGYVTGLSVALWLFVFAVLVIVYRRLAQRQEKLRSYNAAWILKGTILGAFFYVASLLTVYLFSFSSYEAVRLGGFERYMATYLTGILGVFIFVFTHDFCRQYQHGYTVILLFMLFNVNFYPLTQITLTAPYGARKTMEQREPYSAVSRLPEILNQNSRVYFISQHDMGKDYYTSRYCATPVQFIQGMWGWSLGPAYDENDVWTWNISSDEWRKILIDGQYTHVYIYRADQQFIDLFQSLFQNPEEIQDNTLFEIRADGQGELSLQKY